MNKSKLFDLFKNIYILPSYKNRYGKSFMPVRYFLELTYRCNLNCPYCYIGEERNKNELTTEDWFKVIDQLPFYALPTIVGGEPLIRKDFLEILEKASKKTFNKVHLVTNGILINDEIIKAFDKNRLLLLSVSLDGYGETHNQNRGKDGIFDKIITNLEQVSKIKHKPLIDIKTIVLENNLDDLVKLYRLCTDMNFDYLSVAFLRNNSYRQSSVLHNEFIQEYNGNYPIKLYFDMEHFKEVMREIESLSKKSKVQLRFSPKFEYCKNPLESIEKFFSYDETKPITEIYKPCVYPYFTMMINPEGEVYPCLSQRIGNVKESTLKELFNMPSYRCFRKNLKASGGCFGACQMCCELEPRL